MTEERVIRASLKELITDGRLGPIRLGTARAVIAELLGEPDDYSSNSGTRQRKRLAPAIWKYGDIELHFTDSTDQLYLIFLEHFTVPSGGTKLQLDPWIIQQSLTADTLQQALAHDHISVQSNRQPYNDRETVRLCTGVGVEFLFTTTTRSDGSAAGLAAVSYRPLESNSPQ